MGLGESSWIVVVSLALNKGYGVLLLLPLCYLARVEINDGLPTAAELGL